MRQLTMKQFNKKMANGKILFFDTQSNLGFTKKFNFTIIDYDIDYLCISNRIKLTNHFLVKNEDYDREALKILLKIFKGEKVERFEFDALGQKQVQFANDDYYYPYGFKKDDLAFWFTEEQIANPFDAIKDILLRDNLNPDISVTPRTSIHY